MKQYLLSILVVCNATIVQAQQTPQYPIVVPANASLHYAGPLLAHTGARTQSLYLPSEFPGAPAGVISHLYVKASKDLTADVHFKALFIRMGYKNSESGGDSSSFNAIHPLYWNNTDTVLFAQNYTIPATDSGQWVRIALQKPFPYNATKSFIVDIQHDSSSIYPPNGLYLLTFGPSILRMYDGIRTYSPSAGWTWNGPNIAPSVHVIGFDITPTNVHHVNGIGDFQLYPNPATDHFTINLNATRQIDDLKLTLTSVSGSTISTQRFAHISGGFTKQIDMKGMAKGLYFVEVIADNERIVKKLVIQ